MEAAEELSRPTLRRATPEDAPAISRLLAEVFPKNPKTDPDILRWQYWESPYGEAVARVWEAEGRIVSHMTSMKMPVSIGGRRELAAMKVDAATLPEYRRMGLYTATNPHNRGEMIQQGVISSIGFRRPAIKIPANTMFVPSFEGPARRFVMPTDDAWIAERMRLPLWVAKAGRRLLAKPRRTGLNATENPDLPEDADGLWAEIMTKLPNGVRKENAWLNWRYGLHPKSPYRFFEFRSAGRLQGLAITRETEAIGARFTYLMEFLTLDREVARALVRSAIEAAAGTAGVALLAIPGTPTADLALATGMRVLPRRLEPEPLKFVVLEFKGARPEVGEGWTTSFGDMDHL